MIPVEASCRADYDTIKEAVTQLLGTKLQSGQITGCETYAIEYKARNNHGLRREDIINRVGAAMESMCPMAKVLLSDPDLTILVNVLKTICCIAVVKNYLQYKPLADAVASATRQEKRLWKMKKPP
ncbi:unnamed protein product [Soboliphyme baturini]|uniref:THUMP domain-containing protein n=1 Tax=Soboliphyme baturini TaxID=241478 RepID=A0A183IIU7_9BILA|nr:unnamed protein product [Soboliphyme baturini]